LENMRTAKIIGDPTSNNPAFNIDNPLFWLRMTSDQVEQSTGIGQIWGRAFNLLAAQGGAGNIGIVSSLDHSNSVANFEIDYTPPEHTRRLSTRSRTICRNSGGIGQICIETPSIRAH